MPDAAAQPTDHAFTAGRVVVLASALAAPLVHAALLPEHSRLLWLSLGAMGVAAVLRLLAPAGAVPAVIAIGPIWQLLASRLVDQTDPHVCAAWLGAAVVASSGSGSRWQVGGWWRLGLASWALALAVSWPVVAFRELDFTL